MSYNISGFIDDQTSEIFKLNQKQKIGVGGFNMMAVVDYTPTYSNSITSIPLEDGSYATDHVQYNPLIIEINGAVSDVFQMQTALQNIYNRSLAAVGSVDQYLPNYTRQQINRINQLVINTENVIDQVDNYINSAQQVSNLFYVQKSITEQFFDIMESFVDSRQTIKVEIPYRVYSDMQILSFTPFFTAEMQGAARFKIVLIQMKFTKTLYTDVSKLYQKPSTTVSDQLAANDDRGVNKTVEVPTSTAYALLNGVS